MKYKRLAGSKRGLGKWYTLWLGEDHLLAVESTGYSEEYTRYYFKDIQAIVSRRTVTGKVWNAVLGAILAILAVAGFNAVGDSSLLAVLAVFFVPLLLMLLWNLFLGPTCRCHLRTPVGIVELSSLDRIRSVRKMLEKVRPLVTQIQGLITRPEIIALAKAAKDVPPAAIPAAAKLPGPTAPAAGKEAPTYRGGLHLAAFLLLLSDAGLSFLQRMHNSKPIVILAVFINLIFLILAIMALIRQRSHHVAGFARLMTWGGVATMVAGSIVGYFFMIFLNMRTFKGGIATQNDLIDLYAGIQPAEHPSFAFFLLAYALIAAVISIAGLIAIGKDRVRTEGNQPSV